MFKTRFQVEVTVVGTGTVKHFVKATDQDAAARKIRGVYRGRSLSDLVVMSPDQVREHQEAVKAAHDAERKAKAVA